MQNVPTVYSRECSEVRNTKTSTLQFTTYLRTYIQTNSRYPTHIHTHEQQISYTHTQTRTVDILHTYIHTVTNLAEDGASSCSGDARLSSSPAYQLPSIPFPFVSVYWVIGYTCFELVFVCRLFKGTRPAGYLCGPVFCYLVYECKEYFFLDSLVRCILGRVVSCALVFCMSGGSTVYGIKYPQTELPAFCA